MDKGFKDPIKPKVSPKKKPAPFDFISPEYDQRSSCYVNVGSHYGEGFKQPVGTKGNPSQKAATLPFGKIKTLPTYVAPTENLDMEMTE